MTEDGKRRMSDEPKPTCVLCAWRGGCQKKFSITDPSHCPDYSRDLSIGDEPDDTGDESGS